MENSQQVRFLKALGALVVLISISASVRICEAQAKIPTITIHARRYRFRPSEITLKQGQTVKLVFISDDVAHGIVVPGLGIDLSIEKKRSVAETITPHATGDFKGMCSRYCGAGHSGMTFVIHVVP